MSAGGDPETDDIRSRVTRGLGWVGASQVALQVIRTGGAIVVARLLAPEEYGLAMLALVFASLVLVFSDLALGAALVQRKNLTEADRCTAFWITIASGIVFTVVGVALSGPVAALYGEPDVQPLLAALSASFISRSSSVRPAALPGRNVRSEPIPAMSSSMRCNVEAIVTSRTGSANAPPRTIKPSAPTEKSPLIALVPECRPLTDCT